MLLPMVDSTSIWLLFLSLLGNDRDAQLIGRSQAAPACADFAASMFHAWQLFLNERDDIG